MGEMKVCGPPSPRFGVAFGEHADRNRIPGSRDRLELPRLCAHEPVRRRAGVVCFGSKPGETDGDTATNGVAVLPACLGADEEDFPGAARYPRCYVRPVEVHFSCGVGGGDDHFPQPTIPRDDSGAAWNSQAAVQLCDGCKIHAVTSDCICRI